LKEMFCGFLWYFQSHPGIVSQIMTQLFISTALLIHNPHLSS
jgi:hypothetical protein